MYRHGDLLIVRMTEEINKEHKREDKVLAEGEVTGHHHRLQGNATIYGKQDGIQYVEIVDPTKLVHEEHATIDLMPGNYKVFRQREYNYMPDFQKSEERKLQEETKERRVMD